MRLSFTLLDCEYKSVFVRMNVLHYTCIHERTYVASVPRLSVLGLFELIGLQGSLRVLGFEG